MIGEYPLEEWHGGKVRHIIRDGQPDDKHTLVYYAILPLEQKESAAAGSGNYSVEEAKL